MDIQFINDVMKLLQKALEWLQEMCRAAGLEGLEPFSLLPQKSPLDLTTVHREDWDDERIRREYRRMLNRNRVRRWREKRKNAVAVTGNAVTVACDTDSVTGNAVTIECDTDSAAGDTNSTAGNANTVTRNATTITGNADTITGNATTVTGNADTITGNAKPVTGNADTITGNAAAKENEKRKKQRKELKKINKNDIADAMPNSARMCKEEIAEAETKKETGREPGTGTPFPAALPGVTPNALPGVTPNAAPGTTTATTSATNKQELIPTEALPEPCRKVVLAWNRLPLQTKLRGLFPSLVKRLRSLLETYGEPQVHKAIASIADSPFLLGRSKNSRGWIISFSWMLDPEHLEKILNGQYLDREPGGFDNGRLFQPGDELRPLPEGFYGSVVY